MINEKIVINGKTIANRVVFQPMEGCDCHEDGRPSEFTDRKYMKFARSGAGIIWFEANAICPEGRTNPRQMLLTRQNADEFADLVWRVKRASYEKFGYEPILILQLTHSGRQSIHPMVAYRNAVYEETRPVTDDAVVSDEYVATLPALYAKSAALAEEVGFDGVDVKCCHGYLTHEFLSAYSRKGNYGGSYENRTRLLLDSAKAVKASISDHMIMASRYTGCDMVPYPNGFGTDAENNIDLSETIRLIGELAAAGVELFNTTIGNPYYNPHVNRPYRLGVTGQKSPEDPQVGLERFLFVEKTIKAAHPDKLFVGSGLSFYKNDMLEEADRQISDGVCDFAGFGRATLAYPQFYADWLAGNFDPKKNCVTCSKCTALMRMKCISGCAVFDEYYRDLYRSKKA